MVDIFGNNIVSAFTGGNPVKAIYTYGEQVWPEEPSYYYISWTPTDLSGTFTIDGTTYNLEDYSGFFSDYSGVITVSAFKNTHFTTLKTNAISVESYAFYNCQYIERLNLTRCSTVGHAAFYNCVSFNNVHIPHCSYIDDWGFAFCFNTVYTTLSAPECKYIGDKGFWDCRSLTSISLPECEYIGESAFGQCWSLSYINLPKCSYISSGGFYCCSNLKKAILPSCEYIGSITFNQCYSLSSLYLPICKYIDRNALGRTNLSSLDLPVCSYIGGYNISIHVNLTLRSTSVCVIESTTIYSTSSLSSFVGSIYVPSSLVSDYKSAQYWSEYSNYIYPITN